MDSRKTLNLKNGLTMPEILIGLTIIAIVSTLLASIVFLSFRLFNRHNSSIEISSQNKLALDEIINQIKEGESIVDTCANCGGDTTSQTTLILRLWPLDADGNPKDPSGIYDYVVYKRDATDNTKLVKQIIADPTSSRASSTKFLASNISDLQFTYDNPDPLIATEITVKIITTDTSGGQTVTNTQEAKAALRNK